MFLTAQILLFKFSNCPAHPCNSDGWNESSEYIDLDSRNILINNGNNYLIVCTHRRSAQHGMPYNLFVKEGSWTTWLDT